LSQLELSPPNAAFKTDAGAVTVTAPTFTITLFTVEVSVSLEGICADADVSFPLLPLPPLPLIVTSTGVGDEECVDRSTSVPACFEELNVDVADASVVIAEFI
jgi:hypothetical protein